MGLLNSFINGIKVCLNENKLKDDTNYSVEWYSRKIQIMNGEVRLEETFEFLPYCIESASKDLYRNLDLFYTLEAQLAELEEKMLDRTPIVLGDQIRSIRQKVQKLLEIPVSDTDFLDRAKQNLKQQLMEIYKNLVFNQLNHLVPRRKLIDWYESSSDKHDLKLANNALLEFLNPSITENQRIVLKRALHNLRGAFEEFYGFILDKINRLENFRGLHKNEELLESVKCIQRQLKNIHNCSQIFEEAKEHEQKFFLENQQEFLIEGVCLGAVVSHTIDQLEGTAASIQANARSRFIQCVHLLNMATHSDYLHEFIMENLGRTAGLRFLEILIKIPIKNIYLTEDGLREILDASTVALDEFEFLQKKVKKLDLKRFANVLDVYFDSVLPANFLKKFDLFIESLRGPNKEEHFSGMEIGEFFGNLLGTLVKETNENSHYLLTVSQLITEEYVCADVPREKVFNKIEAMEKALLKARRILGENPPTKVLNRVTSNLYIKELLEKSNELSTLHRHHALYLKLSSPYELADVNAAGFKSFTTEDLNEFKLYLLYWFQGHPYQNVSGLFRLKKSTPES